MAASAQRTPQASYAAPHGSALAGKVIAVGSIVFLIITIIVGIQYVQKSQGATVKARITNFERVDDTHLRAGFDVSRDNPGEDSFCILSALNYDKVEVGRREVLIPAGGRTNTRLSTIITTRDIPVAADLYGCSTTIPFYLTETPVDR